MECYEFTDADVNEAHQYLQTAEIEIDFGDASEDERAFIIILYCIKKTKEKLIGAMQ